MKKLLIIVFATIAAVWLLGSLSTPGTVAPPANAAAEQAKLEAFQKAVAARVSGSSKWEGIEVNNASGASYSLKLWYRTRPGGQAEVSRDAKAVVQATLDELIAQGRQPAQERIFVSTHAYQSEKGATGQALVRVFGRAIYDFNNDSITYKPE
jgi:hypothetical protein